MDKPNFIDPAMQGTNTQPSSSKKTRQRWLLLGLLIALLALFFLAGGPQLVSMDTLKTHRASLQTFVTEHFIASLFLFMGLYTGLVAISFPGAGYLSIFGGFLFGTIIGSAAVIIAATLGAVIAFLAARYIFGESLGQKAGPTLRKLEAGLKANELSYMFILRLVPLFPFFIVNIAPALFGVKLRNFILATLIGIIPGTVVYVSVGDGIGAVFDRGEDANLSGLMSDPRILLPILGLALLALIPVFYQKFKARQG